MFTTRARVFLFTLATLTLKTYAQTPTTTSTTNTTTTTTTAADPAEKRVIDSLIEQLDINPEERQAASKIITNYAAADALYFYEHSNAWLDASLDAKKARDTNDTAALAQAEKVTTQIEDHREILRDKMLAELQKAIPPAAYLKFKRALPADPATRLSAPTIQTLDAAPPTTTNTTTTTSTTTSQPALTPEEKTAIEKIAAQYQSLADKALADLQKSVSPANFLLLKAEFASHSAAPPDGPTLVAETTLDTIENITPQQREAARKVLRDYTVGVREYQNANFQAWADAKSNLSKAQQEKDAAKIALVEKAEKAVNKITADLQTLRAQMLADLEKNLPDAAYQKLKTHFPEVTNPRLVANFPRGTTQPARATLESFLEKINLTKEDRAIVDKSIADFRAGEADWSKTNQKTLTELRTAARKARAENNPADLAATTESINKLIAQRESLRTKMIADLEKNLPPATFLQIEPFLHLGGSPLAPTTRPITRTILAPTGKAMQPLTAEQIQTATQIVTKMKTALENSKDDADKQTIFLNYYLQLTQVFTEEQYAQFLAIITSIKTTNATQPTTQTTQTAPTTRP